MRTYLRVQWRRLFGLNVSQVAPLLFVGGEFRPSQWPQIYDLGVRAVLNLQSEREDRFDGPPPDRTLRLFVSDFHAPTISQISEGVAFITAAHLDSLAVFIHCHAGVGRAPLMAAAYMISRHGMSYHEALGRVRAARPIIAPNLRQIARLREYEKRTRRR
ncbi:MAG: dual specificity protein phosphatase [Chloroflexales bacterium]